MKKKTPILLLLSVAVYCLFSCKKDTFVSNLLREAEMLMEQSSDSSLTLLQNIESPEKLPKKQYALWCLLLTQAEDKNYIKHTSDSLIKIAVSYFEKTEEKEYLMKSYYYAATTYHDMGASPHAQEFYLKALEIGKNTENHAMLGRIYSNLGSIYTFQKLYDVAFDFERKAIGHFSCVNDSINIGKTLQNIGRIYSVTDQVDSAFFYYSEALPFVTSGNRVSIYSEIGNLHKYKKKYDETFRFIMLALESLTSKNDTIPIYYNLGEYYRLTGQYDSAFFYLNKCLQSDNLYSAEGACLNLAYMEESRQNWKESAAYYKKHQQLQDSVDNITRTEDLQRIQGFFNYQQIEKDRDFHQLESNKKTIRIYQILLGSVVIVIILLLLLFHFRKKKRKEDEHHEKSLRIEQQKYMQSEEYLREKEKKIKKLEQSLSNIEQRLSEKGINSKFYSGTLYNKIIDTKTKLDDSDWEELGIRIDFTFSDFSNRLKMLYPAIEYSDLKLCYLKKINIPVKSIAEKLTLTSQGVSKKWQRLHKKIMGEPGDCKKMDDFIGSF